MIVLRGGSGLGDSLYVQSVARHMVEQGEKVEVCTDYPDVFLPLKGKVTVSGFRRTGANRIAHYVARKDIKNTDMFQDCCISAGLREPVDLRLDWTPTNAEIVERIKGQKRRPVIAVLLPRQPMARKDGFGEELLPDCARIQEAVNFLRRKGAYIVQVGSGKPLYRLNMIHLDLANRTSVAELLDIAWAVDGFLGYCSFFVPLAESLGKPALFVWSRRGLASQKKFISTVTPEKVLHRPSSRSIMDDSNEFELLGAVNALLVQARATGAV